MSSSLIALLVPLALMAAPFDQSAAVELRYNGAFSKGARDGEGSAVKRFSLYSAVSKLADGQRQLAFVVDERGGGGWSWPERYGQVLLDAQFNATSPTRPRLLYDHNGTPTVIVVQLPVFPKGESLKTGAKWTDGKESWEVTRTQKVSERNCFQIEASTNFGRKRTVWVEAGTALVVSFEERIFIGQGEEHTLTMQLESIKPLDEEQYSRVQQPLQTLLKLQSDLQRPEGEMRGELTESQLKSASQVLPKLQKEAADTPFGQIAAVINRDLKAQLQRTDEVVKLAQKFIGQQAPELSLKTIEKKPIDPASLKGQIVVLHFWDYQGEPLLEPYGQVGYLEFLHSKRRKLGVQVIGVAVDGRLAEEPTSTAAIRSVQKLKSFMNLDYNIALDDGKLLKKFGDPRQFGAKLPVWIVIGPDGKIVHYHVGFYKINPDEGLRELDELLIKLIKAQKGKAAAAE